MQGKVLQLFITHDNTAKTREKKEKIELDTDGIIGDKFYAKDLNRAILITSKDSYILAQENGIDISEGILGENILVDINPYHLLPGERFFIGNTEMEITQNCTLCKGLTSVNSKLPKLLKNDRGIFAKAINGSSTIVIGDSVKI